MPATYKDGIRGIQGPRRRHVYRGKVTSGKEEFFFNFSKFTIVTLHLNLSPAISIALKPEVIYIFGKRKRRPL